MILLITILLLGHARASSGVEDRVIAILECADESIPDPEPLCAAFCSELFAPKTPCAVERESRGTC